MSSFFISKAIPLEQITAAAGAIGASYSLIGTFTSPVEVMYIMSTLDGAVQLSFDGGVTDHVAVPAGNTMPVWMPIDFKSNRMVMPSFSVMVKDIGATGAGAIYISAFSASIP